MVEVLENHIQSVLDEEGLTKEIIEYTLLEVEFSPVICVRGESLQDAVPVSESTDPNKFLLRHWKYPEGWVTRDQLRIMRARYLLALRGPPNPNPIATFDTTTPEGIDEAKQFMGKLFDAIRGNPTP